MIDIEIDVFDQVVRVVGAMYPQAHFSSERVEAPSEFPFVSIEEADNTTYTPSVTGDGSAHHANVSFTVEVYSDRTVGRKKECRDIAQAVDLAMGAIGLTRTMMSPMPNLLDRGVYRIVARYRCVAGEDKMIYRR